MNSFKEYVCSKIKSHICYSFIYFFVGVISLFIVATVFSQTVINSADNGNFALQFDGVNDEVIIGNASNLDILGDMTICLWYKTESPYWGALVSNHDHINPDNGYQVTSSSLYDEGGFIYFECAYNDDRDGQSTYASFNDGQWHFVSAVYTPDGSSRGRIFVDGIEQSGYFWGGSVALPAIGATPEYALTIGSAKVQAWFEGFIDDVRIWNRALSIEEIRTNMYTQLTGLENGLVGYWPFNEGTGDLVNDNSSNNNPGTVSGATWVTSGAPLDGYYFYADPHFAYLENVFNTSILGVNTHFSDNGGTSNIWLSKNDIKIFATSFQVHSNTSLTVEFNIPSNATIGLWDMNIETSIDSVLSLKDVIEIVREGNYALQFDGMNDFVDIGNFTGYSDSVTIEAWIKTSGSHPYEWFDIMAGDCEDVFLAIVENQLNFAAQCGYPIDHEVFSSALFSDNIWHHVAGTYDGAEICIYVDGVQVDCQQASGSFTPTDKSIGASHGEHEFFNGLIDDVRFWNIARTEQEIRANMYNHLSGSEKGLIGYWPFNEGVGNMATDFSGQNYHGTLRGATWIGSSAPIGTVIIFCYPNYGYQDHNLFATIQGANTHFLDGTKSVWLSSGDHNIAAVRYFVSSNTIIDAKFYIPPDAIPGQWNINVETTIDSIITIPVGIEVLPPPSVVTQTNATTSWLRSVSAINDKICWSAGNNGIIQMTKNGGETWELQKSGTPNVLYSILFINSLKGWAVGQYGTILSTTNGGAEWKSQNSGTSNNLQSVYFIDSSVGWAVGSSGTILKTTDGGITWESQNSGTSSWLYSTCFIDANNGWTVGNNGSILKTSDGGTTWNPQTSGTTDYLFSVHFIDSEKGWVAGSDGLILNTIDGGANWVSQESETSVWLRSVFFKDSNVGWATGNNGILMMTTDGGENWSSRKTWTNKTLNSICFVDDHAGWIVGESGTVLSMTMSNLATAIEDDIKKPSLPQNFVLHQNYPNPFNPTTKINYQLPITNYVELSIYNILGEKVATLVSGKKAAGHYQVEWNGTDQIGQKVSSGIYLYKLETDTEVQVRKMILIK